MPGSRDESLAVALRFNSTIAAAQSDVHAAKHAFRMTDGAFLPKFYLEGRATRFDNAYPYIGVTHEDYAGKVVMSWDVFRGGQDVWRRTEMAERHTEATMRHARLQRGAYESIDKAWNARTFTLTRISALTRQLEADRKTIAPLSEYELPTLSDRPVERSKSLFHGLGIAYLGALLSFCHHQLLAALNLD
jgi:adhesin transport system outer membrane protein